MLELARLLALIAFVALLLAFLVFLRRAGELLAETRERETFRRAVADLVSRVSTSLDGVAGRIDLVRRHTLAADAITDNLAAATEAVARYTDEARALRGPAAAAEIRSALVIDLERAGRALQMVEHGCSILASARVGGRELEAQTSIKRGYLNILHAREAVLRHGARAGELAAASPPRLFQRRNA
jgi:hypothetical protein